MCLISKEFFFPLMPASISSIPPSHLLHFVIIVLLSVCNPLLQGRNLRCVCVCANKGKRKEHSHFGCCFCPACALLINHYEITETKTKTSIKKDENWEDGMDCEENANNDQRLK